MLFSVIYSVDVPGDEEISRFAPPDLRLWDYPEDDRHNGASGQVLDLDYLMIYGQEGSKMPFPCRYHGNGLPLEGVLPTEFEQVD